MSAMMIFDPAPDRADAAEPPPPAAACDRPILVVDSGLGGLSVARAIRQKLPAERVVYFGDTARMPYGSKSPEQIAACVEQVVAYAARHAPKHVVLACNSASATALEPLRARFPEVSFSGVIEPGARAAAAAAGEKLHCTIAVIATEATIRSRAYERAIGRRRVKARVVTRATPLLAAMVEEGRDGRDALVRACLEEYLTPLRAYAPDVLVLGCTHYPVLAEACGRTMGPGCAVVDSAQACAADVALRLRSAGLLRRGEADGGPVTLLASDESPRFRKLAEMFLGETVAGVKVVAPDRLIAAAALNGEAMRIAPEPRRLSA